MHFFLNVFISILHLYMFRAASAHHQEVKSVSIHHLVQHTVVEFPPDRPVSHPLEYVVPDGVLIHTEPPDDEHLLLETCRGEK